MYITGHSQRFAIGGASLMPGGTNDVKNLNSPKEQSYIINLGERTETEFLRGKGAKGLTKNDSSRFDVKNRSPEPIPERSKGLKNKIRPKRSLEHQPNITHSSTKDLISAIPSA